MTPDEATRIEGALNSLTDVVSGLREAFAGFEASVGQRLDQGREKFDDIECWQRDHDEFHGEKLEPRIRRNEDRWTRVLALAGVGGFLFGALVAPLLLDVVRSLVERLS